MPSHPDRVRQQYQYAIGEEITGLTSEIPRFGEAPRFLKCPTCHEQFMELSRVDSRVNASRFKACCSDALSQDRMI